MVKMRVKENATGSARDFIGQIVEVSFRGGLYFNKDDVPFEDDELEPIEEVAAPPKETPTESEWVGVKPDGIIVKDGEKGIRYNAEDPVHSPKHYQFSDFEPIKVIQAWDLSFALGNVVKYIARAGRKDSSKLIEDLEKAKRYLELELEHLRK